MFKISKTQSGTQTVLLFITLKGLISMWSKQEDKINQDEHRSKKAVPTTFIHRKHLKGWAKVLIFILIIIKIYKYLLEIFFYHENKTEINIIIAF